MSRAVRGRNRTLDPRRDPPPASDGERAEEGDRPAVEAGRQDGPSGHRPADDARMSVAAAAQHPGPVARADQAVAPGGAAVDREADSAVAAADGGTGPGAHGAPLRRGAAGQPPRGGRPSCTAACCHGTTMEVDFGESWVDIAGVPCKIKYLVATLPFSNAYFDKAYPVERLESLLDGIESAFRYIGAWVKRVVLDNTSLAVKGGVGGPGPGADRGVRGVSGRISVPGRVLRAGQGLGEGSRGRRRQIRQEPRVPAAAGGGELGGPQRGYHHGTGGRPADTPTRRRALGRASVGRGAPAPASAARSPSRHLSCRDTGCRQVRTRPRGPRDVLGTDPPRLPAGVGEAISRPRRDRGRRRGGRRASPGVRPGREGARCASPTAVTGAQAPGRGRGDGASRLAAQEAPETGRVPRGAEETSAPGRRVPESPADRDPVQGARRHHEREAGEPPRGGFRGARLHRGAVREGAATP